MGTWKRLRENWPDLVPRTPRIGDRSKPRLGHSAGSSTAPVPLSGRDRFDLQTAAQE